MRNRSNNLKCCADTSLLSPSDRFNVLGMKPLHIGLVLAVFLSLLVTCFHMTLLTDSLAHQSALDELHEKFQRCLAVNAVGLTATQLDVCRVQLSFHRDTQPKWKDPKTGDLEGLAHEFNLCKVLNEWEQIRNSSVILTREFLEALPDGWHTYAWRRINKGDQLYGRFFPPLHGPSLSVPQTTMHPEIAGHQLFDVASPYLAFVKHG